MDGKCGTCGDAYDAEVRENEAGGIYATGFIGRNYTRGQVITVFKPFRQPLYSLMGKLIKCLTHKKLSLLTKSTIIFFYTGTLVFVLMCQTCNLKTTSVICQS